MQGTAGLIIYLSDKIRANGQLYPFSFILYRNATNLQFCCIKCPFAHNIPTLYGTHKKHMNKAPVLYGYFTFTYLIDVKCIIHWFTFHKCRIPMDNS